MSSGKRRRCACAGTATAKSSTPALWSAAAGVTFGTYHSPPHLFWHGQCVNHACDLAILSVADPEFWANIKPLAISPIIPHLFENVVVVGFPMGGDNICVTRGVVSRVTTLSYQEPKYYDPGPEIMAIQIDAAINSGNSGGWVPYRSGAVEGFCLASYSPLLFLSPPGGAMLC